MKIDSENELIRLLAAVVLRTSGTGGKIRLTDFDLAAIENKALTINIDNDEKVVELVVSNGIDALLDEEDEDD